MITKDKNKINNSKHLIPKQPQSLDNVIQQTISELELTMNTTSKIKSLLLFY